MNDEHRPLTPDQLKQALRKLPGWRYEDGRLKAEFNFRNFSAAFAFMTQVAMAAEKLNHHPDMLNSYSHVNFELWTHETKGISQHDIELAERINRLAKS